MKPYLIAELLFAWPPAFSVTQWAVISTACAIDTNLRFVQRTWPNTKSQRRRTYRRSLTFPSDSGQVFGLCRPHGKSHKLTISYKAAYHDFRRQRCWHIRGTFHVSLADCLDRLASLCGKH